ncbi:MAG: class I SAM-dependent methyltransferase [Proteobacteria bacterium]|nr:class I SAM-dependent methyltransferase [Pseudomonadota bacterium]
MQKFSSQDTPELSATRFDLSQMMVVPNSLQGVPGRQVLGIFPTDKYYKQSTEVENFVQKEFKDAIALDTDADMLRYTSDNVSIDGFYLEMGVGRGITINFLAALNPKIWVYGFDSFEGLPEDWDRGNGVTPKGTWAFKSTQTMPLVLNNVTLIKGWFKETLSQFKNTVLKNDPIALIHIDCDLYSSTAEIFKILGDNMVAGSILLFDEYYNYPAFKEHEYKAFNEFLVKSGKTAKAIAFNQYFQQAAFRIL